jgi:4-hydroxybenzoate polyprenyltransferase
MVDMKTDPSRHSTAVARWWRDLWVSLRPLQWTKNGVVLAPLIFGGLLTDGHAVIRAAAATVAFCAAGSALYLFNDWRDAEADRQHPLKCNRPIAAGRLGARTLVLSIVGLLAAAALLSWMVERMLLLVLGGFAGLMLLYTLVLKHLVLIDVLAIAGGFILRAVAGAVAVGVPLSPWLYVCTVLLALFLGFAKRRHEIVLLEDRAVDHRRILNDYSVALLDALLAVTAAATLMAYSLYTFSAPNLPGNHAMMLTIPFVLYGIFRYLYLVYCRAQGGLPEQVLLDDVPLLASIVLWGLASVSILYAPWLL